MLLQVIALAKPVGKTELTMPEGIGAKPEMGSLFVMPETGMDVAEMDDCGGTIEDPEIADG